MSKVIIVNQSSGYLAVDVVNAFCLKYDEVTLICGRLSPADRPLNPKVKVVQLTPYDKSSIVKRISSWYSFYRQMRRILRNEPEDTYILYFTNPPFSYFAARKMPNPYSIGVYDLCPDGLKNMRCPNFIINFWGKRNRQIFGRARWLFTLSNGMAKSVAAYSTRDNVRVIHNWGMDSEATVVPETENKFLKENHLEGKFIVLYSGNIGYSHNVEVLTEVAKVMRNEPDVAFVIIGEGGKKALLVEEIRREKLTNCYMLPYLPVEDLKYSLSAADLGVVTLTEQTATVSVPSKTYNLLSYGVPLLCIVPENTELSNIVETYGCGSTFSKDEVDKIVGFIRKCKSDNEYLTALRKGAATAGSQFTYKNAENYTI